MSNLLYFSIQCLKIKILKIFYNNPDITLMHSFMTKKKKKLFQLDHSRTYTI